AGEVHQAISDNTIGINIAVAVGGDVVAYDPTVRQASLLDGHRLEDVRPHKLVVVRQLQHVPRETAFLSSSYRVVPRAGSKSRIVTESSREIDIAARHGDAGTRPSAREGGDLVLPQKMAVGIDLGRKGRTAELRGRRIAGHIRVAGAI